MRTRGRGNKNVRLFPKREKGTSCRWVSTALHKGEGREETPLTDTHGNTDTTLSFPLSLWGICTHPASSPHRSAPGTWRDDISCKACNQQATIGASNSVTVQAGGCSGQSLVKVAEFTTSSATIFQPLYATSDVTVAGVLTVDGTVGFNGGIQTNTISPATGTSLTLGGVGDTVTVAGDLTVTGTSTHAGLETFNGDNATDLIFSTDPATSSVNIPGTGTSSTQIGDSATASGIHSIAMGYQRKCKWRWGEVRVWCALTRLRIIHCPTHTAQASAAYSIAMGYKGKCEWSLRGVSAGCGLRLMPHHSLSHAHS